MQNEEKVEWVILCRGRPAKKAKANSPSPKERGTRMTSVSAFEDGRKGRRYAGRDVLDKPWSYKKTKRRRAAALQKSLGEAVLESVGGGGGARVEVKFHEDI